MKVKEKRQFLRDHKIINEWDLCKQLGTSYFVSFIPYSGGLCARVGWYLTHPIRTLNPKTVGEYRHWSETVNSIPLRTARGRKSDKAIALEQATKLCGITDWIPSPLLSSSYVSKAHLEAVIQKLLAEEKV